MNATLALFVLFAFPSDKLYLVAEVWLQAFLGLVAIKRREDP